MRHEFLIKMMTFKNGKEKMIKTFYSNNITELLKLYLLAKEEDIQIDIPEENKGHSEYDGHEAYVDDIRITFGGKETITCLNIYVEVM